MVLNDSVCSYLYCLYLCTILVHVVTSVCWQARIGALYLLGMNQIYHIIYIPNVFIGVHVLYQYFTFIFVAVSYCTCEK